LNGRLVPDVLDELVDPRHDAAVRLQILDLRLDLVPVLRQLVGQLADLHGDGPADARRRHQRQQHDDHHRRHAPRNEPLDQNHQRVEDEAEQHRQAERHKHRLGEGDRGDDQDDAEQRRHRVGPARLAGRAGGGASRWHIRAAATDPIVAAADWSASRNHTATAPFVAAPQLGERQRKKYPGDTETQRIQTERNRRSGQIRLRHAAWAPRAQLG
jgi:hypothetical protein